MTDFHKKAQKIAKQFQTIDQLTTWIEKALKRTFKEGREFDKKHQVIEIKRGKYDL